MKKILIIDDEPEMLEFLEDLLTTKGYDVAISDNPRDMLIYDDLNNYDLIILDVMMPEMNGFDYFKEVKNFTHTPIVFLTASDSEDSIIKGLSLGAEDYLLKPFSSKFLIAKINNILARKDKKLESNYTSHGIEIDMINRSAKIGNEELDLTKTEFMLLTTLSSMQEKTFTHEELHQRLLEYDTDTEIRVVTQYIYQLRSKLKKYGVYPIKNIWGVGYKWIAE